MRVGIDAHYIGSRAGGNETYTRQLLSGLRRIATELDITALVHPEVVGTPALEGWPSHPLPVRSSYLRVPFALPYLAHKLKLDLLHVQYTAPPILPPRYVVTLHDNVAFRFPESMPFADRHRLRLLSGRTLRKAARVLTVSEAMKRDLCGFFDLHPGRVDVGPNALDERFRTPASEAAIAQVREKYRLPERFVLYLGLLQPRKNLVRLWQAFQQISHQIPHALVIAGRVAWMHEPMFEVPRLITTGYVPDEDLPALYAAAEVFAFPSLYEGFGIPVIEALACGTPVLASTAEALVEVAGGGALHEDPLDVEGMAQALLQLIHDEELRRKLVAIGRPHALAYTPERLAEAVRLCYVRALEQE